MSKPVRGNVLGLRSRGKLRPSILLVTALSASAIGGAVASGCSADDKAAGSEGGGANACLSTREFFATKVMGPVFLNNCYQCHGPGGPGSQKSEFQILPASYPGFIDANLDNLRTKIVPKSVSNVPQLLAKPTMKTAHEGGLRLEAGTPEYDALVELQNRLSSGEEPCGESVASVPAEVVLADAASTLRKASLQLAGRLPTAEEIAGVTNDPATLDAALLALTKEEAFYDWMRIAFNDALLTDQFLQYNGRAIDNMSGKDFAAIDDYKGDGAQKDNRAGVNRALAREPVELMLHTVRNDLPFSNVLTADYTVVNPELAKIYKNATIEGAFNGDPSDDDREWLIARVATDDGTAVPHAGVITTPMWLNRYPTSPTNRSRGRARVLMKLFLATDILEVANRPVDATAVSTLPNATLNQQECITCHAIIDPIAGGFRGFGATDYEHFSPQEAVSGWYNDMKLPGYGNDPMDPADYPLAARWVGKRIADDPRFAVGAVRLAYTSLTGRELSSFPKSDSEAYASEYAAWKAEDAFIRETAATFDANGRKFRDLILTIVKSPYYRAIAVSSGFPAERLGEVSKLGTARLSTPEVLRRKISAVAGVPWRMHYEWTKNHDWFGEETLRVLYGGIDSDSVIRRARDPNSIMANIQLRLANEVAILAVPYDFSKPAANRVLFPNIEMEDIAVGSEAKVKAAVVHLHQHILGETLAEDDPEIVATIKLFQDTLADGGSVAANGKKERENYMPWPGGINPTTGEDIKVGETNFRADNTYALRAWATVVTYLLSDSKFLID
jgi:hypothetical protein